MIPTWLAIVLMFAAFYLGFFVAAACAVSGRGARR